MSSIAGLCTRDRPFPPGREPPAAPPWTSGTVPSLPEGRGPRRRGGQAAHVPSPSAPSQNTKSLFRPAFRHDGRPVRFCGTKDAVIATAKSRSACCCTIWSRAQPLMRGAGSGKLPTLLQITGPLLRPECQCACCSIARFQMNRAGAEWSRSTVSWAGEGSRRYRVIRTQERLTLSFRGGEAAFRLRPTAGDCRPRS